MKRGVEGGGGEWVGEGRARRETREKAEEEEAEEKKFVLTGHWS